MKTLHLVLGAALLATPLAACGGDAPPAVQESRVEEARLQEFADLLPAAPRDWTASPVATSTGDKISSISKTYSSAKGDAFSVEINFSNEETAKMQTSIRNFLTRNKGRPSVILLDGMTYIITNTDFRSFLKIAQKMKDDVYQAQSLLLLPYEPKNLAENEMNLLINEMS